jgi:hypothetical protein
MPTSHLKWSQGPQCGSLGSLNSRDQLLSVLFCATNTTKLCIGLNPRTTTDAISGYGRARLYVCRCCRLNPLEENHEIRREFRTLVCQEPKICVDMRQRREVPSCRAIQTGSSSPEYQDVKELESRQYPDVESPSFVYDTYHYPVEPADDQL